MTNLGLMPEFSINGHCPESFITVIRMPFYIYIVDTTTKVRVIVSFDPYALLFRFAFY